MNRGAGAEVEVRWRFILRGRVQVLYMRPCQMGDSLFVVGAKRTTRSEQMTRSTLLKCLMSLFTSGSFESFSRSRLLSCSAAGKSAASAMTR